MLKFIIKTLPGTEGVECEKQRREQRNLTLEKKKKKRKVFPGNSKFFAGVC